MVALTVALPSCGDDAPDTPRAGRVYAAVVRAMVPVLEGDEQVSRDIYVAAVDEAEPIPIGVQAETVEQLDEYSNVRFVDARDEAIATDEPDAPVRNEGVLVVVGSVPERGDEVRIDVERYVDERDDESYRLTVAQVGTRWEVVDPPPIDGG